MAVCPSQTSLTDSDLSSVYGGAVRQGILQAEPYQQSDREGNGLLKTTSLQQIIVTLKSKGVIPKPPKIQHDSLNKLLLEDQNKQQTQFLEKQKALLKNLNDEYCFYDARYKYSLQKLLVSIQQAYINNSTQNQQLINGYLTSTQLLNQRLNDLAQVSNAITIDMLSSTTALKKEIKAFNTDIKTKQLQLEKQNKILSSQQAVEKLNKEQVKFTEEKARYTNNLLKMYSFLNIVALGLLVYVYRSAS
jgi:hypothetical protein